MQKRVLCEPTLQVGTHMRNFPAVPTCYPVSKYHIITQTCTLHEVPQAYQTCLVAMFAIPDNDSLFFFVQEN